MDGPLPLDELLSRTYEKLGSNTTLYSDSETVSNGLNPAQNLLVLLDPALLTRRVAVDLVAEQAFIDLRTYAPRVITVRRITQGNVVHEDVTRSLGDVKPLTMTTRETLRWRSSQWWRKTGVPKEWYLHGKHFVGLYPRAAMAMTVTLIYTSLPTPFVAEQLTDVSPLPILLHPLLPQLAAALLLAKESSVEAQRAVTHFSQILGEEPTASIRTAMGRLARRQAQQQAQPVEVS